MLRKNNYSLRNILQVVLGILLFPGMIYSCASIGHPDGGPIDETPPRFVGSNPRAGSTNATRTRIVLEFDEFIKLEKPNEKVVISPPQVRQPEIRPGSKRITVNLLDSLKPNTTYTIDFADAIVDNNEGNPLGDFTFTFSTGDVIDTMAVSGTMLEASNLEPIKGMLVGLHANLADSAFLTQPFDRVSRTDSRGRFTIRGIAPGTYRLYGLADADQNFAFTQKSEAIAFHDSLIIPRLEERLRQDTVWKDTITIDTIIERKYTHYLPDDLMLRAFTEKPTNQFLVKSERLVPHRFTLYFNVEADTLPTLRGLNFDERDAFIIEKTPQNDTVSYWIRDSLVYKVDTLKFALDYLFTDTLQRLVPRTDTLKLASRRAIGKSRASESSRKRRGKEENEPEPTVFLNMNVQASAAMDVYDDIKLTFDEPVLFYDSTAIHLRQKVDTLWYDVPYLFQQDTIQTRMYHIVSNWEPGAEYEFELDSIAFVGLYGLHTDKQTKTFKVKVLEDYLSIYFNITGAHPNSFVELLDAQDRVVRTRRVENGQADFDFLTPGKYGARLIEDMNGNGVWDTGNFEEGIQPEKVYYFPKLLEQKANWQMEEDWNIRGTPLDRQKPNDLKKQKPDEEKRTRTSRDRQSHNH